MGSQQNYVLSYLEIHRKGQNIYVENKTNGDVFEINEAAAEVIQYMQKGVPLAEIQVRVAPKYPDEEIDVFDFVKQLKELGLVQSDADAAVKEQDQGALKNKWDNIPVNVAKLLFNPYAYTIYILLFVRNLSLFFIHPHLIPNYHDVFISPSITISYIFWFIISTFVVLFHEFGHILAARAYDLSPRLSVGYRLFYIVMETDLGRIWKLPSKARNVPFLGGICFDQIMLCAALTVQLWAPYTFWAVVGKVVAFHIFLTLIFQCLIFMKTDLYFVFENAWSTHNLQDNARNQLARFIPFMKKDKETNVFAGEERVLRLYLVIYVAGLIGMGVLFVQYFIPQIIYGYGQAIQHLHLSPRTMLFWDGVSLFVVQLLTIALLIFLWIRDKKITASKR